MGMALLRYVTGLWPRSAAERMAGVFVGVDAGRDAVLESALPLLGDDSFTLAEAGVDLGDPVVMFPGAVVDDDAVKCASADSAAGVGPAAVSPRPPSGQPQDLVAMDCCGGVVGHRWLCPTQAARRGTGITGTWRFTPQELQRMGLSVGDQLGEGVIGPPIDSGLTVFRVYRP